MNIKKLLASCLIGATVIGTGVVSFAASATCTETTFYNKAGQVISVDHSVDVPSNARSQVIKVNFRQNEIDFETGKPTGNYLISREVRHTW